MAVDPSEARLKFLKEAAYQLASSAPIVSSDLLFTYNKSVIDTEDDLQRAEKEWNTLRRETCGACGNIMLPGWSSSAIHQSRPGMAKKRPQKTATPLKKQMVTVCLRCDRKSVQSLQPRRPKHVTLSTKHEKVEVVETGPPSAKQVGQDQDKVAKSANATSKQRKKSRKGGLQAMLEKNKKQSSGDGLGLNLMDFMQ